MASGGNEPVSDIGGKGNSVFANAFIVSLRGMERKTFTAEQLFYEHIKERAAGNADQTPEYNVIRNSGHDDGDFVFKLTEQPYYSLHIASSKTLHEAKRKAEQFNNKGHRASIRKSNIPGKGEWYRIYLGNYRNKDEASEFGKRLKNNRVIDYFSVHQIKDAGEAGN